MRIFLWRKTKSAKVVAMKKDEAPPQCRSTDKTEPHSHEIHHHGATSPSTPTQHSPTAPQMVMVMGDQKVGKTTLVSRLNAVFNHSSSADTPTLRTISTEHIGMMRSTLPVPEDSNMKFVEWNSAVAASLQRLAEHQKPQQHSPVHPSEVADSNHGRSSPAPKLPNLILVRPSPPDVVSPFSSSPQEEDAQEMQTIATPVLTKVFGEESQQEARGLCGRGLRPQALVREFVCPEVTTTTHCPYVAAPLALPPIISPSTGTAVSPPPSSIRLSSHPSGQAKGLLLVQSFLLCYDVGKRTSLLHLVQECLLQVRDLSGPGAKVVVVGTKADAAVKKGGRREVLAAQGEALANSLGGRFLEVGNECGMGELLTILRQK